MPFRWRWPWRKPAAFPDLADLQIVFYTRTGCHLCDTAWERLRRAQRRYRFTLTTVDVDTDRELVARYGDCVPVVTVNGKVRFRGAVNPILLSRLLTAEGARRNRR